MPPDYPPMTTWYSASHSPTPAPPEYWEDSDVHPPLSNPPRLLSNGHGFIEVPWSSQYMFIHTGSSSPGPVPSASVSAPMDVAIELVDPNPQWGPNIASEHHKVTSNLLSPHQSSAFQPSPHQSAACQPSPQPLLAPPYSRLRQSPTSHTAHTASHLSPTSTTTSTRASTPPISDEEARWTLSIWIMSSDWLRKDEMEPMVGDPGVPPCALQLASKGESVYSCFLVPVIDGDGKLSGYKSTAYPTSKADRHQRAIARERANRGHCPFKCPRNHDPNCEFKGCSKESLSDHLAPRNNPTECPRCLKLVATKNMLRHLTAVHGQ